MRARAGVLPVLLGIPGLVVGQTPDEAVRTLESGLLPTFVVEGRDTMRVSLADRMEELGVPGVSVAVMVDGELAWARAWGVADGVSERPLTPETLMQAASISKPVAALALWRMAEAGRLDMDRDVNELLASWALPDDEGFTADEKVTLRRLLSHSAGTTVWGFPGYRTDEAVPSTVDVLDGRGNTDPVRLFRPPGVGWQYSGGGYTVAQLVAEDVFGSDFATLMRTWVLDPVGMTRSTYAQPLPEARRDEAALAHMADGTPYPGGMHVYPEQAAAGLWTTPSELLVYARAVQEAAAGAPGAVLGRERAREMLTPVFDDHAVGPAIQVDGAHFGHGGSNAGFRSTLTASIEEGYGVAVMTNGDQGGRIASEVVLTLAHLYGWAGPVPAVRTPAILDPSDLERLAGRYRLEGTDLELEVAVEGDGIALSIPGEVQRFIPESPTRFWERETGAILTVELDAGGEVLAFQFQGRRVVRIEGG